MNDPYLYPHTDILKNLADIRDREMLLCMEAEYTGIRLAELVIGESASRFDFASLCDMHHEFSLKIKFREYSLKSSGLEFSKIPAKSVKYIVPAI